MSLPGGIGLGDTQPRRGGSLLLVLGAVIVIAGILGVAYGIGQAIGQASAISGDAVARGVASQATGEGIAFESSNPDLTVYLDFHGHNGFVVDSTVQDDSVAGTTCTVTGRDGYSRTFGGDRQGTAATIGEYSSVGSFTLPSPSGRISCVLQRFNIRGPDQVAFLVTPHGTGEVTVPVLIIIGCVFGGIAGGSVAFVGWSRRRTRARLAEL